MRPEIPRPSDFGTVGIWTPAAGRTASIVSSKYATIPDYSGHARDLAQATPGNRAVQVVDSGRKGAQFASANSTYLVSPSFTIAQPFVFWAVLKSTVQDGTAIVAAGDNNNVAYLASISTTQVYMNAAGTPLQPTYNWTSAFASYVCIFNGASSSMRINGSQVGAGDVGSASCFLLELGGFATSLYFDGTIQDAGIFVGLPPSILDFEKYYLRRTFRTW